MCHPYFAVFRTYVKHLNLSWHHYQMENPRRLGSAFLELRSLPVGRLARTIAGPGPKHRAADRRLRRFLGNPRLDEKAEDAAVSCVLRLLLPRLGAVPFAPVMLDGSSWASTPSSGCRFPAAAARVPFGRCSASPCIPGRSLMMNRARAKPSSSSWIGSLLVGVLFVLPHPSV